MKSQQVNKKAAKLAATKHLQGFAGLPPPFVKLLAVNLLL